ncbi:MAG TPA: hypothetical protein VJN44_00240 [Roseateles sp.]|nr:hypothetical protein [Roseateles sp.]
MTWASALHSCCSRPDADIISLPGVGHWPQFEAVAAAMLEFLDTARPAESASR